MNFKVFLEESELLEGSVTVKRASLAITKEGLAELYKNAKPLQGKLELSVIEKVFLKKPYSKDWVEKIFEFLVLAIEKKPLPSYSTLIQQRALQWGGTKTTFEDVMVGLGFKTAGTGRNISYVLDGSGVASTNTPNNKVSGNEPTKSSVIKFSIHADGGWIMLNDIALSPFSDYGYEKIKSEHVEKVLKYLVPGQEKKVESAFNGRYKGVLFDEHQFGSYTNRIGKRSGSLSVAKAAFENLFDYLNDKFGMNITIDYDVEDYTDLNIVVKHDTVKKADPRLPKAEALRKQVQLIQTKLRELDDLMNTADKESKDMIGGDGLNYKGNQLYHLRKIEISTDKLDNFINSIK